MALGLNRKFYHRLSADCVSGCFVECWSKISDGKPVDSESAEFNEIFVAIEHYFQKSSRERGDYNIFERSILRTRYNYWVLRDISRTDAKRAYRFVLKHRLASIIRRYANLNNYVAYIASREMKSWEINSAVEPSVCYWKGRVDFSQLPPVLHANTKPNKVGSYLRKNVVQLKHQLAESNYLKLDPSFSDITAFITLSGTLLLVLGYLRVHVLGAYFGFPFQDYFGTTDYLKTSVSLTGQYLFSAVLTAFLGFLYLATAGAYSRQEPDLQRRSIPGRINSFTYHAVGISSALALVVVYYNTRTIESVTLLVALLYVGGFFIPRVAMSFFKESLKAYLMLWLIFLAAVGTVSGVVREIRKLNMVPPIGEGRLLEFADRKFSENDWQFIAFTSEYVIMRDRLTQSVVVRNRSGLKSIESKQER